MRRLRFHFLGFTCLGLLIALLGSALPASAQPNLTVSPLTWNVVGLDSNDVTVGPNHFPVGARVCNTGDTAATNVTSSFVWDSSDPYIRLRPGSRSEYTGANALASLAASECHDFYYEVQVVRDSAAYDHTRRYHISASADDLGTSSTPQPREIYVEHLISQNRNSITDVQLDGTSVPAGGTMALLLGETYTIEVIGSTATNGYNQIETFIHLPNTIFEVQSVETTYSADTSPYVSSPSDKLYGDGCLWDNDPNSPTYRACTGVDGKVGGDVTVTYQIQIIGGAGTSENLNTLIYDFSGSSYHYNSDFGVDGRVAAIIDPSQVTISKSFTPNPTIVEGASRLTFTISNPNDAALDELNFTDSLPSSPGSMVVADPPEPATAGCGTPTFSPTAGSSTLSFSGGTVAANGTCTVSVNVTAPATGDYGNTSGNLFIGSTDTGNSASATLTVNDEPADPPPVCGLVMAQWTFTGISDPPPQPAPSTQASDVDTAAISVGGTDPGSLTDEADGGSGNPAPSLLTYGWPNAGPVDTDTDPFIQFAIDTSNYTGVEMSFDAEVKSNGPDTDELHFSTDGTTWTLKSGFTPSTSWSSHGPFDFTGQTSTTGTTFFRVYGFGANTPSKGADLSFDNVTFTGCGTPEPPTLSKSFTPVAVAVGGSSTLEFTLTNPNPGLSLSDIEFDDTLPSGVAVTSGSASVCGGTLTRTAPSTISFSGGSLAAGANCTASVAVTVTTAGPHDNISGYISASESGENTDPDGSASASVTGLLAPSISKQFAPNPILTGQTSTLTFTLSNPNTDDALTGVTFSDTFPTSPGSLLVADPTGASTSDCGSPTYAPTAGTGSVSFSGGTIAAGGTCTVTVDVTATPVGEYDNTSAAVSADTVGAGNTASDTLIIQPVHPGVSILKRVSTSSSGPWAPFVGVTEGSDVFFQMTVENIGDVPLTDVNVTDPTLTGGGLDLSGCAWSDMPLFDVQTCVVGPISAVAGSNDNTATSHGNYSGTTYDSSPSTATHATTGLTIEKSVTENFYSAPGDELNYSYLVTNSGSATLSGPVTVSDDRSTDESCPDVSTVGDNDAFLDAGESITCAATYTVTSADISAGSVTNNASAEADGVTSNTDSETVFVNLPELSVTKTNDTSGSATVGIPFTWSLTPANLGPVDAAFADGQTILSDPLPAGATYGSPSVGGLTNVTGGTNIDCSIDGSNVLTCVANGGPVTIGADTGEFTVSITTTPTASGSLSSTTTVDPDDQITEADEDNNTAMDSVTVGSADVFDPAVTKAVDPESAQVGDTVTFTLTITNDGNADAEGVVVNDDVPTFLDISSVVVSPSGPSVTVSGNSISIDFGTVSPSDSFTVTITTVVNSLGMPPGGTNEAVLTTTSDDADPSNNTGSAELSIFAVSALRAPATGFVPGRTTWLPAQPQSDAYETYEGMWLELPSLGADVGVLGVPLGADGWDVTWLGGQAGYLAGTAFPTWPGNSVVTGHAVLPSGLPGPFARLSELAYGDRVVVHAWGANYIYEVREADVVHPADPAIFRHEERAWLTLLTCQGFDERSESYLRRQIVRAVLVALEIP